MLNILLIGSGARESALATAIRRTHLPHQLFCIGTHHNPKLTAICQHYDTADLTDCDQICQLACRWQISFAVIGPIDPLVAGLVDALKSHDILSVGPTAELAQIESSQIFSRMLLKQYQIRNQPQFKYFDDPTGLADYLMHLGENYVLKADGLMDGTGVKVAGDHLQSHHEALAYANTLFDTGQTLLVEEKLVGEDFSLLSFTDGYHVIHMPIIQADKQALTFLSAIQVQQAHEMNQATIAALRQGTGQPYRGILQGKYRLTTNGVKIIKYKARFGESEAVDLLARLETDFIEICQALLKGCLHQVDIKFKPTRQGMQR